MFNKKFKRKPFIENMDKEKIILNNEKVLNANEAKKIFIFGLYSRAGASFIAFNLAKNFSENGIETTLIEDPKNPFFFDMLFLEKKYEDGFISIPHKILDNSYDKNHIGVKKDSLRLLVTDPRLKVIDEFAELDYMKLLNISKDTVIFDSGSFEEKKLKNIALNQSDLIIIVTEPLPSELNNSIDKIKEIQELSKSYNIRFVLNMTSSEINRKEIVNFLGEEPMMEISTVPKELIHKAIFKNKDLYDLSKNELIQQFNKFKAELY